MRRVIVGLAALVAVVVVAGCGGEEPAEISYNPDFTSLVTEGKVIPDNSMVMGSPGKVVKELTEKHMHIIKMSALHYVENFKRYKRDLVVDERFQ